LWWEAGEKGKRGRDTKEKENPKLGGRLWRQSMSVRAGSPGKEEGGADVRRFQGEEKLRKAITSRGLSRCNIFNFKKGGGRRSHLEKKRKRGDWGKDHFFKGRAGLRYFASEE